MAWRGGGHKQMVQAHPVALAAGCFTAAAVAELSLRSYGPIRGHAMLRRLACRQQIVQAHPTGLAAGATVAVFFEAATPRVPPWACPAQRSAARSWRRPAAVRLAGAPSAIGLSLAPSEEPQRAAAWSGGGFMGSPAAAAASRTKSSSRSMMEEHARDVAMEPRACSPVRHTDIYDFCNDYLPI